MLRRSWAWQHRAGAALALAGGLALAADLALEPLGIGDPGFGENQVLLAIAAVVLLVIGSAMALLRRAGPVVLLGCSTLLTLGLAEAGLRVLDHLRPPALVADDLLGWRPAPGYHDHGPQVNAAGEQYQLACTTDEYGFRVVVNAAAGRPRLLAIGDSYTHAIEVSDGQVWVAVLANRLGFAAHAYAASGWATLQETLAIEQLVPQLDPEVVVWQLCDNDLFNATAELERACPVYNIGRRRPYLSATGDIVYQVPTAWPRLRHLVDSHWRLGSLVMARWRQHRLASEPGATSTVEALQAAGLDDPMVRTAAARVEAAAARAAVALGQRPVVLFSSDTVAVTSQVYRGIAAAHGWTWVDAVPVQVARLGPAGRAADRFHWSPAGHAAVAGALTTAVAAALQQAQPGQDGISSSLP